MHIGITGPVSTVQLSPILHLPSGTNVPTGMGGVPVNNLILELHRRGYRLSVFSHSPDVPEGRPVVLHGDNITVYYGHYRPRARHRILDWYKAERQFIADSIRHVRPDVVHAHWQYEWGWGALDSGVPTLLTCHDSPLDVLRSVRDGYRLFRLAVAARVLRRATHLTTVSPYVADRLKLFTSRPVRVIPNLEPPSVFDRFRVRSVGAAPSICLVNNAFDRRKNVQTAFLAFRRLRTHHPAATLHLYGTDFGPGEAAHQWAQQQGCTEGVVFHGPLGFEALMDAMARHDVFLHTSLEESFGMVLVEAAAMGLPVVAGARSGGVPWVMPPDTALLTDVSSPDAVAQALETLLTDPALFASLRARAVQNAQTRFSADAVVNQYLTAYETCLTTPSRPAYFV
jgi:L-malate glycosyltransferase